jgi:hypothetical protein
MILRLPAALPAILVLVLLGPVGRVAAAPAQWIQDHLVVDASVVAGWRSGWQDVERSGFQALLGGGELNVGLGFSGGLYGVLAGVRVLAGSSPSADLGYPSLLYLETTGQLGAQVRVAEWVRLQGGISLGQAWRGLGEEADPARGVLLVCGGFLRMGVDWWPRDAQFLRALSLWLRLDLDGHPAAAAASFPSTTVALALGLGIRL